MTADPASAPTPAVPAKGGSKLPRILLGILGLALALLALVYLFRSPIASAFAARAAAEQGVACEPLDLSLSWDLGTITVAPTTCRFEDEENKLRSLGLPSGATVGLDGTSLRSLRAPRLDLEMRARQDPSGILAGALGGARRGGRPTVPPPLRQALSGLAEMSATAEIPEVHVEAVEIGAAGSHVARVRQVAVRRDEARALRITAASLHPAASQERGPLTISGAIAAIEARANAAEARIEARVSVRIEGPRGRRAHAIPVRFQGSALDSEHPEYAMWADLPEELERLMELRERVRDRMEDRPSGPIRDAVRDRLRDRIEERREEGGPLRDRLRR